MKHFLTFEEAFENRWTGFFTIEGDLFAYFGLVIDTKENPTDWYQLLSGSFLTLNKEVENYSGSFVVEKFLQIEPQTSAWIVMANVYIQRSTYNVGDMVDFETERSTDGAYAKGMGEIISVIHTHESGKLPKYKIDIDGDSIVVGEPYIKRRYTEEDMNKKLGLQNS